VNNFKLRNVSGLNIFYQNPSETVRCTCSKSHHRHRIKWWL